jgi:hypothetical protein
VPDSTEMNEDADNRGFPPAPAADPKSSEAWAARADQLWQRARKIAASRPGIDVSGVYHALRNLERPPEERLRRGLKSWPKPR